MPGIGTGRFNLLSQTKKQIEEELRIQTINTLFDSTSSPDFSPLLTPGERFHFIALTIKPSLTSWDILIFCFYAK